MDRGSFPKGDYVPANIWVSAGHTSSYALASAYGKLSDQDLKDIFAYLQSLPPVKNKVPDPIPPDQMAASLRNKMILYFAAQLYWPNNPVYREGDFIRHIPLYHLTYELVYLSEQFDGLQIIEKNIFHISYIIFHFQRGGLPAHFPHSSVVIKGKCKRENFYREL